MPASDPVYRLAIGVNLRGERQGPNDATKSILVDSQRTRRLETSVTGKLDEKWSVLAYYAFLDAVLTKKQSATVLAGNRLANVPKHSLGVWTRYDFLKDWGAGLGLTYYSLRFAATDNTVRLDGYPRLDAAIFYKVTENVGAQLNFENISNTKYIAVADNNLSPGSPFAVKFKLTTRF